MDGFCCDIGHCRRRKIRCLISKDDLVGRCSNCIRLKKACIFHPVETPERRPSLPSKPEVPSNDICSATSSPSPGVGHGQTFENTSGYSASVPVTPTYDPSVPRFDDSYQAISGHPPRIPISQSASVSRRPSYVHIHTVLGTKPIEQAFMALAEGVPGAPWELPPRQESQTMFPDVQQSSFEDPSQSFWRLNLPAVSGVHNPQHSLHSMNSMASLTGPESLESYDGGLYSQGPSRMSSIDHGPGGMYGYPITNSSEGGFSSTPDLHSSANASTASLAASFSEASQYSGPGGDSGYRQHYMTNWVDRTASGIGLDSEDIVKGEEEEGPHSRYLFQLEDRIYSLNESFSLPT